jgi:hypothetical protein
LKRLAPLGVPTQHIMSDQPETKIEEAGKTTNEATPAATEVVPIQSDYDAGPSATVSRSRQSLSDLFTIVRTWIALLES